MRHILFNILVVSVFFSPVSCGINNRGEAGSQIASISEPTTKQLNGTAYDGKECSLELQKDAEGRLLSLRLTEDFKVDYKIPAPMSGLYGVYYWSATFDTQNHLKNHELRIKRSWLNDADIIEGDGTPLFWSSGSNHHKLVIKPSLENPKSLTYHSAEYLLGGIPFVMIDGTCEFH